MPNAPLAIYLQDHRAGSTAGVNLARRFAGNNAGSPSGRALAEVASEIEADQETLAGLMADLGIPASRAKNAAAWLAERAARLKPNGRVRGEPAMQRLHELETLSLGIAGKRALWEALRVVPEVTSRIDLDELVDRAQSQRETVEAERMRFARAALAPASTIHGTREEAPA